MLYEHRKHDGSLPIVGVNTFLPRERDDDAPVTVELARATEAEKQSQLDRLADFHVRNAERAPEALARLQRVAMDGGNVFAELMTAVRCCSLGQISDAFFEVGGQYRRDVSAHGRWRLHDHPAPVRPDRGGSPSGAPADGREPPPAWPRSPRSCVRRPSCRHGSTMCCARSS